MGSADVATFVARLESGKVSAEEFSALRPADWDAVRGFLALRRQEQLQRYLNALYLLRMKADPAWVSGARTYSEADILAEFAPHD